MTPIETICIVFAALWLAGLFSFLNWARKEEQRAYQAEIEHWRRFAMENGHPIDIQQPSRYCAKKRDPQ